MSRRKSVENEDGVRKSHHRRAKIDDGDRVVESGNLFDSAGSQPPPPRRRGKEQLQRSWTNLESIGRDCATVQSIDPLSKISD